MEHLSLRLRRGMAWALCIGWMAFIFLMSAMPGDVSGAQSGTVVRILLALHDALFGHAELSPQALSLLETLVRKGAHMAEYAVLALLLCHAMRLSGMKRPARRALLVCLVYAATDEFHQSFVGGRGPSPVDVMIDTAGAALAMAARGIIKKAAKISAKRRRGLGTGPQARGLGDEIPQRSYIAKRP